MPPQVGGAVRNPVLTPARGGAILIAPGDSYEGLHVIDVAHPASPVVVSSIAASGRAIFDVSVSGNFAYAADYLNGLWVIDVANPAAPVEIGALSIPKWTHSVAATGRYVYLGSTDGVHVIDVVDPTHPVKVGFYRVSGGVTLAGGRAYVGAGDGGMWVLQFTGGSPLTNKVYLPLVMR